MIKEYKDWLFVEVPSSGHSFQLHLKYNHIVFYQGDSSFKSMRDFELPPGSWQIIGKWDEIEWEGIVEMDDPHPFYKNYADSFGMMTTALDSGISLLRSLDMEPRTTLVLKKQTKLK